MMRLIFVLAIAMVGCKSTQFNANARSGARVADDPVPSYSPGVIASPSPGVPGSEFIGESGSDLVGDNVGGGILKNSGFDCQNSKKGLIGKLYRLPTNTKNLPNFATMTPLGLVEAMKLDVPERKWTSGFPGIPSLVEWFAIEFFAVLNIPETNSYRFRTNSDDGSKVFIDDQLVVSNDGTHGPTVVTGNAIQLEQGPHKIKIEWFQGPRTQIALQLYWAKGAESFRIIDNLSFTAPTNCKNGTVVGSFN